MSFLASSSERRPLEITAWDSEPWTATPTEASERFDFLVRFIRQAAPKWRELKSTKPEAAREYDRALRFTIDLIKARLEAWEPTGEPS